MSLLWWGSNYGGALLSWVEAPLVQLFGVRPWLFAVVDGALVVAGAFVLRAIGQRMTSRSAAAVAAGAFTFFPALWLFWSSRDYLFWVPAIVLALTACLLALQWFEEPSPFRLVGCGFCSGVSIWLYPLALPLIAPPFVALLWNRRRDLKAVLALIAAAFVGVSPWLAYFALHGRSALHRQAVTDSRTQALGKSVTRVLPALFLAGQKRFDVIWTLNAPSKVVLTLTGITIFLAVLVSTTYALLRREYVLLGCGVSVLLWAPILSLGHVPLFVYTFRYGVIVVPPLLLIGAYWASRVRMLWLLAIALVISTAWTAGTDTGGFKSVALCSDATKSVNEILDTHHLTAVWAAYWLSGPLEICSNQRITTSSLAPSRDQVAKEKVEAAPRTTFVVFAKQPLDAEIAAWTTAHHLHGNRLLVGTYAIWEFDHRIDPRPMRLDSAF